jgi:CRP-like cAMP-binding protein
MLSMNKKHYFQRRSHLDLLRANLWQIETGIVRATTCLDDGSSITLGFWGAGDLVGNALFRPEKYQLECLSAVTASPLLAECCAVGVGNHLPSGTVSPVENRAMFSHIEQLQELLVIRSYKRIEDKLVKLLTWLGNRFGTPVETGSILSIVMTHQDLAETLSTTRVTITRSMRDLEHQGFIRHIAKRRLLINTAISSIDPVPQQLFETIPLSSRHGSILPLIGVAAPKSNRALINSY